MTWKNFERGAASCVLLALLSAVGLAQGQGESKVDQLEKKVDDLESQIKNLQDQQQQGQGEVDESFDEVDEQMLGLSKLLSELTAGKRKFLVTGYASGGFEHAEHEDSTFTAGFNPIFLWKVSDRIFLEAEIELEFGDADTEVALEYAQMSYVINDYTTLGLGRFLSPGNAFAERLHPAWINKLPDKPLAVGASRILPFTQLGVQLHGAVPLGSHKLNYVVYASNGPTLEEGSTKFGMLDDHNFTDANNNKAAGGRIGYFPLPELEVGYALEFSQVTAGGSSVSDADAIIQSVDLNYVTSVAQGTLDVRAQWAFSDVDNVTFDPAGVGGFGPVSLDNERNGGYVQAAFRPSELESSMLSDFEGVVRYDMVDLPSGAPEGTDESRVTIGVNYWAGPSSVFKLAYQIDDTDAPGRDSNALLFQWATGF